MRYLRFGFLAVLAAVLVTVALANSDSVTLTVLPTDMAALLGWNASMTLPLFMVIMGGIVAGLLIGFVWEWLRERHIRAEAARSRREVARLEGELSRAKAQPAAQAAAVSGTRTDAPRADVVALTDRRRQG